MSTSTEVARRSGPVQIQQAPDAALAIKAGQTAWDSMQLAALGQLGLSDAPAGDLSVFLHQSQRTGLDPFARQIYMIGRKEKRSEKRGGQWVDIWSVKYTIQTGIDGYRVMRDRAKKREGVRVQVSRPLWYDHEGNPYKVWFLAEPPTACEVTVTVDGEEYTSVLLYREYVQTKENPRGERVPIAQWATKPAHMIEKCTEADAYRKAFPQDFSGVLLDDAMPAPDPGEPAAAPPVQRVTAERLRERRPQAATATVVAEDSSPAPAAAPAAPAVTPVQQGAGEDPTTSGASSSAPAPENGSPQQGEPPSASSSGGSTAAPGDMDERPGTVTTPQLNAIWAKLTGDFGFAKTEKEQARAVCAHIVRHDLTHTTMLSKREASRIIDELTAWQHQAEQAGQEPRDYMTALLIEQDAEPAE